MIPVISLLAVILVIGVVFVLGKNGRPVAADAVNAPAAQLPNNAKCLSCHLQPDITMAFPNGDVISVTVDPNHYGNSAHATLDCQVCHTNISDYPHPQNSAQSHREYTLQYTSTCNQCHPTQKNELMDSAHTKIMQAGNTNAPICADCHNPHTQTIIQKTADGKLTPAEHAATALVCAQCHNTIYEEYLNSVHGQGVMVDKNPDVPSCIDCHGVHTIAGPEGNNTFRLSSPQICASCHTNKAIMDKYGISTQVLSTYLSDFHGTTYALFDKIDPDQAVNVPVCYDCHGVHNIAKVDDPNKGLEIKQNILAACQRCHPDATTNFPDAWLSHYIPSPTKYPVVYYVNLFYKFFIPGVLGVMGVFVVSDIYRKTVVNRRKKLAPPAPEGPLPESPKNEADTGNSQPENAPPDSASGLEEGKED